MKPTLLSYYQDTVAPALKEELALANTHQVPTLQKIVVTSAVGSHSDRKQAVEDVVADISKITGQKPSVTYARKSVANFKLREGEAIGARVTLRQSHMWEFLDRFVNITTPNIRDFRGISPKSFDGQGNYAVGVDDQSIFPEIELEKIKRKLGFDIIFVTSTKCDKQAYALLKHLGVPFREIKQKETAE